MLNELRVAELVAALGERTPAPASGAATALTAAMAAALAELAARFAEDEEATVQAKADHKAKCTAIYDVDGHKISDVDAGAGPAVP